MSQFSEEIRNVPDFVGIGVQKGGTTTLHHLLSAHPEVMMPCKKELQYFSNNFQLGPDWYLRHWPKSHPNGLRGEITPYYIFHPYAAPRLKELAPDVKIIVLLRDPVERTLSHYFHSRRLGLEELDLKQALAAEEGRLLHAKEYLRIPGNRHQSHQEHSYISRSRYEEQLVHWLKFFNEKQILILRSEALFKHPDQTWKSLLNFLSLTPTSFPTSAFSHLNAGRGEASQVPADVRNWIHQHLESTYSYMRSLIFS